MPAFAHNGVEVSYREAGTPEPGAPAALLLHSAGGSAAQWRGLMERLGPSMHVLAPELYGHGGTPPWPRGPFSLADEAALAEAAAGLAQGPLRVAAHSYAGSVALHMARRARVEIDRLVLIEPTLFALLRDAGDAQGWASIEGPANEMLDAAEQGRPADGAARFMDYLLGAGAWDALPEARRAAMAGLMDTIALEIEAQLAPGLALHDYAAVGMPVLILCGTETPYAIKQVARLLSASLPFAELRWIEGAGHMAPLTHGETVDGMVEGFVLASL